MWALEGPDAVSASGLVAILAPGATTPIPLSPHEAAPRLAAALGTPVSRTATELFAMGSRADAPDAGDAFGVARTPLVVGLRATVDRAAAVG
jgi:hypothetical protein